MDLPGIVIGGLIGAFIGAFVWAVNRLASTLWRYLSGREDSDDDQRRSA
jgi:hypothetical protein